MNGLVSGNYVRHNLLLVMDLLIVGISRLPPTDENHQERVIMRSTLTLLEMLERNLNKQMEGGDCQ